MGVKNIEVWLCVLLQLVVHVGVSGIARDLTLEQQAHNDGYDKHDVDGACPDSRCCVEGAPLRILSKIDMTKVMECVNHSNCNVRAVVSYDPGRYVDGQPPQILYSHAISVFAQAVREQWK